MIPSKKRSSAELAAAAILSSSHLRKKRTIKKSVDESNVPIDLRQHDDDEDDDPSIVTINDELLKRLSQGRIMKITLLFIRSFFFYSKDFAYLDQRTGLRWIARKTRSQPMSTLLSRFSWKPKINHYEKYSDAIRISKTSLVCRIHLSSRRRFETNCSCENSGDHSTETRATLGIVANRSIDQLSERSSKLETNEDRLNPLSPLVSRHTKNTRQRKI